MATATTTRTKTDTELQRDILDELRWDPSVNEAEIGVAVKDGIATLTGYVDSYFEKWAAERAAKRVSGVKGIVQKIEVRLPGSSQRTDADIARAAVNALQWDISVPHDKIKVKVENGWLTLEGDVDWQFQKHAAERAVRNLVGVRGVSNLVFVKPKASPTELKSKIQDTFKRQAALDASNIKVDVHDGVVTLNGTVRSWAERKEAEQVAWASPGVTDVVNNITIRIP